MALVQCLPFTSIWTVTRYSVFHFNYLSTNYAIDTLQNIMYSACNTGGFSWRKSFSIYCLGKRLNIWVFEYCNIMIFLCMNNWTDDHWQWTVSSDCLIFTALSLHFHLLETHLTTVSMKLLSMTLFLLKNRSMVLFILDVQWKSVYWSF